MFFRKCLIGKYKTPYLYWIGLFSFFLANIVQAQNEKTDQKSDSLLQFISTAPAQSIEKAKAILEFTKNNWRRSDPSFTESLAQEALEITKKAGDNSLVMQSYLILARSHQIRDNYLQALNYFLEALKIAEKINDKQVIGAVYNGLGIIYSNQKEYDKALFYYNKYLAISKELDAPNAVATCLNNMGNIHKDNARYDSALHYYFKALQISNKVIEKTPNLNSLLYSNLADTYTKSKRYDSALFYNEKAYVLLNKIGNRRTLTTCLNNMGLIYLRLGDFEKSEKFLQEGLALSQKIGRKENIKNAYTYLAEFYERKMTFDKALLMDRLANIYKDSLFNEEKTKGMASLQLMYDLDKKQTEVHLLTQERKLDLLIRYGLLAFLVLLGGVIYGVYKNREKTKKINEILTIKNQEINQRSEEIMIIAENLQNANEEIKQQRDVIELKNQSVMASIQTAFRIQSAILPFEYRFDDAFGKDNYFIFYKPRDVVSGDFYFLERIKLDPKKDTEDNYLTVLALADCVGHGVPGAFMSMIGMQTLTEGVMKNHIYEPDKLLNFLQREIRRMLKQNESNTQDGMDAVILSFQKFENFTRIEYAGAMNPLYYVENKKFKEIKGDKMSIGTKRKVPFSYQKHVVEVKQWKGEKNATLYLCSDGFQDQFGGERSKKYMTRHFKELLHSISDQDMQTQEKLLDEALETWMQAGDEKQTDDITVIGIGV